MAIKIALNHRTQYRYERAIAVSPQIIRLRPAAHTRTPVRAYSLKIEPARHFINWQQDPSGNFIARVVLPEKTRTFSFEVDLIAELSVFNPFDFFVESHAEQFPFAYEPLLNAELRPYLKVAAAGPLLRQLLEESRLTPGARIRTIDRLVALNQQVASLVRYVIRMEPGIQTPEETLRLGSGSCRDSAYLLVQMLRHMGFAARFVSGYLIQLRATQTPFDPSAPRGPEKDFTDLHAWTEVYLPGAGWIGLDSTSGLFAGEGHIPLAATPEPESAAPVSGAAESCQTEFEYTMSVHRLASKPANVAARCELHPESDSAQIELEQSLDRIALAVDRDLRQAAVQLTMGGEPTFVYSEDPDGAEWNLTASSPAKRKLAARLTYRLYERFAPGGVLYHGQGKWYPGEELPRWALGFYFRRDGEPIWRAPELLARETPQSSEPLEAMDLRRFIDSLAACLGLSSEAIVPALEDPYYALWQAGAMFERDPPTDPAELWTLFGTVDREIKGFVLPIASNPDVSDTRTRWLTCRWNFKRGALFLTPGDSAIGYRLPLNQIPATPLPDFEVPTETSPLSFEDETPAALRGADSAAGDLDLPGHAALAERIESRRHQAAAPQSRVLKTALSCEVRESRLCVFMPPLTNLDAYLDLIASIETAARDTGLAPIIEGYQPPTDVRLQRLMVTPDPGVIEVNIHPSETWEDLKATVRTLYESARAERLIAEKYQLDGRPMGTGGGNHITLGGAVPLQSPFLRRPELLRSMITYWQHHPALSYLFAGAFIGPTSQAPRIDEARHESLYDLELAFQHLPQATNPEAEPTPARLWLIDRLLRNVLIDLTGNTHRSEFCIDKLYPPEALSQRLGLVELRAFEMPPNAGMYLTVMLLVRALVARFVREPYTQPLVRRGTELHDRFMLPYFLWRDFGAVLEDLQSHGYELEQDRHFGAFFDFRFPLCGTVQIEDTVLELRQALEPWPVLGETSVAGSTARPVDAALERVQLRVTGLTPGQHTILCNGRNLPLHSTGAHGEYVAGVRFKAWGPPNTLHPTIPVHSPLIFELLDLWQKRSLGGCTYHVAHPGGRAYDTRPVNAAEAEARRQARFERTGHTPGNLIDIPASRINPEYPLTLDLRTPSKL